MDGVRVFSGGNDVDRALVIDCKTGNVVPCTEIAPVQNTLLRSGDENRTCANRHRSVSEIEAEFLQSPDRQRKRRGNAVRTDANGSGPFRSERSFLVFRPENLACLRDGRFQPYGNDHFVSNEGRSSAKQEQEGQKKRDERGMEGVSIRFGLVHFQATRRTATGISRCTRWRGSRPSSQCACLPCRSGRCRRFRPRRCEARRGRRAR